MAIFRNVPTSEAQCETKSVSFAAMIASGRCFLSRADSPIPAAAPRSGTENCPLQTTYINRGPYDVHDAFRRFGKSLLRDDRRNTLLFERMAGKSGIELR
jgi:hypothetical protein